MTRPHLRAVLAGGGTAGHTSPLIATANALGERADAEITCIGTAKGLETRVVPAAGLDLQLIPPVPMPRKPTLAWAKLPLRLRAAVRAAQDIITGHGADVVVGFGGYVAMPAYLAARAARIPIVIHEQNSLPGIANRFAASFADRVLVSFPGTPLPGAEFVGLPVRPAVRELAADGRAAHRAAAREEFGLDPRLPCLLVSGGSQGARSLNEATLAAKDQLLASGVQVLHVWGQKNFTDDLVLETNPETGARYQPVAYVDRMELAYAAADLMLARSGAGTVVETSVVGLPAIFVPLPIGNGEQGRNANAALEAGAAVVVPDEELTGDRLLDEVTWRISDAAVLAEMGAAGAALIPADAADRVAEAVLEVARRPRRTRRGSLVRALVGVVRKPGKGK